MNARIEGRLAKLEVRFGVDDDISRMIRDELVIEMLDVTRKLLAWEEAPVEERARWQQSIIDIEDGIRRQAAARRAPGYTAHLAYVAGTRFPSYVPCVCGDPVADPSMLEYQDLDKPRVMERRAAILARPDVQVLIAEAGGVVGHA